jgi:hypothetical protein
MGHGFLPAHGTCEDLVGGAKGERTSLIQLRQDLPDCCQS